MGSTRSFESAEHDAPLRSELFSADQMEQHGRHLAASHRLATRSTPDRLLARLAENERLLGDISALLAEAVASHRRRMASRQLLPGRGADPHGQAAFAQGLQPRAAAPGDGSGSATSTGL